MKKVAIALILILFPIFAQAQDIDFKPAVMADVLYDTKEGALVPVASLQLATFFDNLIETRVMAIGNSEDLSKLSKVGFGVGINLVTLTNKLGQTWTASFINPSIGVAPIYNFSTKSASVGIYVTVIKVQF